MEYVIYFIEDLSTELKQEIRNRLVAVCHGADQAQSLLKIYSYKETVKEFVKRYKTNKDASEDRKKGMIGELLVHVVLELEGRFALVSASFFQGSNRARLPSRETLAAPSFSVRPCSNAPFRS